MLKALGFAFLSCLDAEPVPGIQLVLDTLKLEWADIAVTGEGCLDYQTCMGKAPMGIARLAQKYGVKVIAFAGSVTNGAKACNAAGIDAFFPILRSITTLDIALEKETASANLTACAEQVFRLL